MAYQIREVNSRVVEKNAAMSVHNFHFSHFFEAGWLRVPVRGWIFPRRISSPVDFVPLGFQWAVLFAAMIRQARMDLSRSDDEILLITARSFLSSPMFYEFCATFNLSPDYVKNKEV